MNNLYPGPGHQAGMFSVNLIGNGNFKKSAGFFRNFWGNWKRLGELSELAVEMGLNYEKENLYWLWMLIFVIISVFFFHFVKGIPKAIILFCILFLICSFHRYQ